MIKLSNINKTYNKGKPNAFHTLKNISLEINDGKMIAITGKSGAGKSTLMHIIGLLDNYDSGNYILNDIDISKLSESKKSRLRCDHIGFVLQDFGLISEENVKNNVSVPLYFGGTKLSQIKLKVGKALELVGISEYAKQKVNHLSGGQKQRVAISRAIVNEPKVILADEPTGSLDSKTAIEIMNIFKSFNAEGKTVIIVTHDKDIANMCDRIIEISDGTIISDKTQSSR